MQRQLSTGADFSDQRSPEGDPDERLRLNALAKLAREAAWAGDRAVSVLVAYVESLVNPHTGSAYANALDTEPDALTLPSSTRSCAPFSSRLVPLTPRGRPRGGLGP